MAHPQGIEVQGKEDHAYRLKKTLYGLRQALRSWYIRIND